MPDESTLCGATGDSGVPTVPLRCDLPSGHGGGRHAERWVATWLRDGSDVRWYVGDKAGRPVYRADPPTERGGWSP